MMNWPWLFLSLLISFSAFGGDKLEFFYGPDCNRCERAKAALINYQATHPDIEIVGVDVYESPDHLARLRFIGVKEKIESLDLPAFYYHSTMSAGFSDPMKLTEWLDETRANVGRLGQFNFFGMTVHFEKAGPTLFSALIALKDLVFSFWGGLIILSSLGLIFFNHKFESLIGTLCLMMGAVTSAVLWSLPSTRLFYERTVMIDALFAAVLLLGALYLIVLKGKKSLSGWFELGLFSFGLLSQRVLSLFSGFELLRLQDMLLEAGISGGMQVGMNMVYGLIQLLGLSLIILAFNKIKNK